MGKSESRNLEAEDRRLETGICKMEKGTGRQEKFGYGQKDINVMPNYLFCIYCQSA